MKLVTTSVVFYAVVFTTLIVGCGGGSKQSKEQADGGGDGDGSQENRAELCTVDTACSDGEFCNGVERCNPGAMGADERGCLVASRGPCADKESCQEGGKKCIACSETADVDGDNHDAVNCGGDDCDDNDFNRYPGNAEVCDDKNHDEDCDATTFGDKDADGDTEVDDQCSNTGDDGKRHRGTDCEDSRIDVRSKQLEICDKVDNDCDGKTDEQENKVNWYKDADGDGFGGTVVIEKSCELVSGASLLNTDCDDQKAAIHPGASESCDGIDNNCDGRTDGVAECASCNKSGAKEACACDSSALGVRTCASDGIWSKCNCSPSVPCGEPGYRDPCVCEGDFIGIRSCGADGAWSACKCTGGTVGSGGTGGGGKGGTAGAGGAGGLGGAGGQTATVRVCGATSGIDAGSNTSATEMTPNGSFEQDPPATTDNAVTAWNVDWYTMSDKLVRGTPSRAAHVLEVTSARAFMGVKSLRSFLRNVQGVAGTASEAPFTRRATHDIHLETPISTTANYVTFWRSEISFTTSSRYYWEIVLIFSDGTQTVETILSCKCWGDSEGCPQNLQECSDQTAQGADGQTWHRYRVDIPSAINRSRLLITLRHQQDSWDYTTAESEVYLDAVALE
jgi:hypothetical protein